ncbi:MAG TPA: acyl carrier protein [Patescibacteria group bacterium]|nr:acyl carrier protein [Patescibacteria group bacterium]
MINTQDKNGLQTEVIAEIAKHLGVTPQDIDINAGLTDDLGLGPVEMADLIAAISQKFKVNFSSNDVPRIKTVEDLVVTVEDLSLD